MAMQKRLRLKDRRTIDKLVNRHLNGKKVSLLDKAKDLFRQRKYAETLRLLSDELQTPNRAAFALALECCRQLNDLEKAERIYNRAIKLGLEKDLTPKIVGILLKARQYDKLLELYESTKQLNITERSYYIYFIRFFFERKQFDIVENLIKKARRIIIEKIDLEQIELEYFRQQLQIMTPGRILTLYLKERQNMSISKIATILTILYTKEAFLEIIGICDELPNELRMDESILSTKLSALLKINRQRANIELKDAIEKTNGNQKETYEIMLAYNYKNSGQIIYAQDLFERIMLNISTNSPNYSYALCGYIFTKPKLTNLEITKYKQHLENALTKTNNTRLIKDIKDALSALNIL